MNLKSIRDIHRLIENYKQERSQHLSGEVPNKPEQWDQIYTYLKALTNLYGVVSIEKIYDRKWRLEFILLQLKTVKIFSLSNQIFLLDP
jgi:hypothetical protein